MSYPNEEPSRRTLEVLEAEGAWKEEQRWDADEEYLRTLLPEEAINIQRKMDEGQVELWFTVRYTKGDPDSGIDYYLIHEVTPQDNDPNAEWVWLGLGDVGLLDDPIRITEDPSGTPEPRLEDVRAFVAHALHPR